jgi:MerR family transcriptional regulator/heat shock protein HspR
MLTDIDFLYHMYDTEDKTKHPKKAMAMQHDRPPEPGRGVYGISVAAQLVGMGVQNLRLYERRGLLEPERSAGGTRRYSADDLARLRRISELLAAGLNLAGISAVLDLEAANAQLRSDLANARAANRGPTPRPAPSEGRARPRSPGRSTTVERVDGQLSKRHDRNPGS